MNEKKEQIIAKLHESGCRVTKQRLTIIDIILEGNCSSCKEIIYEAQKRDSSIGAATVYRMVKTLEDIGAIDRKNIYQICYEMPEGEEEGCVLNFVDDTSIMLSMQNWNAVIRSGLRALGYQGNKDIASVEIHSCRK